MSRLCLVCAATIANAAALHHSAVVPRRPALTRRASTPAASLLPAVAAGDPWTAFAVSASGAAAGQRLAVTSRIGATLSGPICAMLLTFVSAASGVLPPATEAVLNAQSLSVQLATPMLLLGANLRAVARRASRLLPAFAVGTLGTALGAPFGVIALRSSPCSLRWALTRSRWCALWPP